MKNTYIQGAVILAAGGLLVKILGAFIRFPLFRLVGSEGMGLYQMAYTVFVTALSLTSAGIPVVISILISERMARKDYPGVKRVFRMALFILTVIGVTVSWEVFRHASFLANEVLGNPKATYAILAVAPAIAPVAIMAVFQGYFQGCQNMTPSALSGVVEQLVRISTVILGASFFLTYGIEMAVMGATLGATTGALAGLLVLLWMYRRHHRQKIGGSLGPLRQERKRSGEKWTVILKRLAFLALPISLGEMVLALIQALDAVIVPARLQVSGYSVSEATALYGNLSAGAFPLVSLPIVATWSLSQSLAPAVAEAMTTNNREMARARMAVAIRMTILLCYPAAAGLLVMAGPLSQLLYGQPEVAVPLSIMAPAALFIGIHQTTVGFFQGMGKSFIPVLTLLFGALCKVFLNYTLVAIPALGITGASLGTVVSFTLAAGLNVWFLGRLGYPLQWKGLWKKPTLAVAAMAGALIISRGALLTHYGSENLATIVAILLGATVYGITLLLTGWLTARDLQAVINSPSLIRLLIKLRLLRP